MAFYLMFLPYAHSSLFYTATRLKNVVRMMNSSDKDDVSNLSKILSPKELDYLGEIIHNKESFLEKEWENLIDLHKNPVEFFTVKYPQDLNKRNLRQYKQSFFLKSFFLKLKERPHLMDELTDRWWLEVVVLKKEVRHIDGQIKVFREHGLEMERVGLSVLANAFNRQMNKFSDKASNMRAKNFVRYFQKLFPDFTHSSEAWMKVFAGDFIVKNRTNSIYEHGKNLIKFLDEVVLRESSQFFVHGDDYWKIFNDMIPAGYRDKYFDRLLLRVWSELEILKGKYPSSDYYEEVITKVLERLFVKKIGGYDQGSTGMSSLLNYRIMSRAADQDESFGEFYHLLLARKNPKVD